MLVVPEKKKTNTGKIFSIAIVIIIGVVILMRVTGMILYYVVPTCSSEPSLHVNEIVFAASFITPKRGDIIIYTNNRTDSIAIASGAPVKQGTNYLHRLCAIQG